MDYTQRNLSEDISDEERTKIVQAMQDCKISIVTKKMRSSSTGTTRYITSIWALSSDRSVRLKQQCKKCFPKTYRDAQSQLTTLV